jgi:predicted metal-dependent hydrolase
MSRSVEHRPPLEPGGLPIEVVRSTRRRRGASAHARDGRIVVQLPAALPPAAADRTIATLVGRVSGQVRARERGGDEWLAERARDVGDAWLEGVTARSVTWSSRMSRRWASATPATGAIRVSDRAAAFPERVLDYLLVHELAHLVEPNHSPAFHELVARYPDTAWAQGFLAGISHAEARPQVHPPPALDPGGEGPPDDTPGGGDAQWWCDG